MNESKISVRYARALFESAVSRNLLDKVYNDMNHILEVSKLPEVREVLESPVIVPSKKEKVLHDILAKDVEKITLSLIDMVLRNGRESFIPSIARVFIHDTMENKGITEAVLTTAVKVDDDLKKQMSEMISRVFNKKVMLEEVVDKDIIGGFILKVEDHYIDASIRNKLRKIKKELTGSSVSAG